MTPADRAAGRARPTPGLLPNLITRAFEAALIVVGLGFIFVAEDDELAYLALWDLLALIYVLAGAIVLRRTRKRPPRTEPVPQILQRYRFNFTFAIVSSLMGFVAALDIAVSDEADDYTILLKILGTIAMIMSWMLLQAGYARRYAGMYRTGGGLTFPGTRYPTAVDFLYFAVTIGTAFSVSDVLVENSRMRWHVLVHSAVSFFYNAAVVAFALSLIAGR
jgi:uncharacterized membrane protein